MTSGSNVVDLTNRLARPAASPPSLLGADLAAVGLIELGAAAVATIAELRNQCEM